MFMLFSWSASEAVMPVVYPVFGVLSLIILIGDIFVNMVFVHRNLLLVMPAMITFSFISGKLHIVHNHVIHL